MYESRKKRINWVKLFLVLVIVVLVILLTIKCITMLNGSNSSTKYYDKQLNQLNEVVLEYYNVDNIPTEVGKSDKLTLNELKDKNVEYNLEAQKGESCDLDKSYVQVTRLDTEYQVKTNIVCGDYEDYINTYVTLEDKTTTTQKVEKTTTVKQEETTTTTKRTETTTTTKKVTTTKRTETTTTTKRTDLTQATNKADTEDEVTISFKAEGNNIPSITIKKNTSTKLPTPTREGYTFVGWYKNGVKYTDDTKFTTGVILIAKWSKN